MAVLDTCKFDEDPIKTECTIDMTRSNMGFFSTQGKGQVTLTWIVWCGWKSNSSKILWRSWLPARLTKIGSKVKSLSSGQHCLHYNSMGKIFVVQGQDNSPIWPIIEIIWDFIAVLVTSRFEEHSIKYEVATNLIRSTMGVFGSQGQVTPKWIFLSSRKSNSSENLWLSRLPASFRFLVWFLFYSPSTHFRSFRARSVTLTTLFLGKPPRQFTSTWCTFFRQ